MRGFALLALLMISLPAYADLNAAMAVLPSPTVYTPHIEVLCKTKSAKDTGDKTECKLAALETQEITAAARGAMEKTQKNDENNPLVLVKNGAMGGAPK